MFRSGKSIPEIAAERKFTVATIEGHLASFISSGEVKVAELVPRYKLDAILKVVEEIGGNAAFPMKEKLGDDYSYGEIRAVISHKQWMSREKSKSVSS